MDETFQQSGQLATIYISGNLLTGIYYPTGTTPPPTLPTSDQGPIMMNGQWYIWDPVTSQYLPQTASVKTAKNFAKNACYQIQQTGASLTINVVGINKLYDMCQCRTSQLGILNAAALGGPTATVDNDDLATGSPAAINYTVSTGLVTLAATDIFAHEHLIEGADIAGIPGQPLSLAFSVMTTTPGVFSAYLTSSNRDASYVFSFTVTTANVWQRIKINNIPQIPNIGTWNYGEGQTGMYLGVVMGCGSQFQTQTPNQWVNGFFAGTSANQNMVAVSNNQLAITGIKFEASPSCTYFTRASFEADFNDCIRYYWTSFTYQSLTAGVALSWTAYIANGCLFSYVFPRRMAKVPTVTFYSWTTPAAGFVTNISTGPNQAVAAFGGSAKGFVVNPAGMTSAKGDVYLAYVTADARLT